jgi:arginine/lysine/ornithine decarboxylase
MPGHNGTGDIPLSHDITEIKGAGVLWCGHDDYDDTDVIAVSERNAARLFGSRGTLYFTGGCTQAVQTGIYALKSIGVRTLFVNEYAHRSVCGTARLIGLDIRVLNAPSFLSVGFDFENTIRELAETPNAALAITSMNYYGEELDFAELNRYVLKHAITAPIFIDDAHGAYRGFDPDIKNTPLFSIGFNGVSSVLVAESAHKTLPALTGAAYLHTLSDNFSKPFLKHCAQVFVSTSPSYLALESLDLCNQIIYENRYGDGTTATDNFADIARLKTALSDLGYTLANSDKVRVTIFTNDYGYRGVDVADIIRVGNGGNSIEPEYADERAVVLLFSPIKNIPVQIITDIFAAIPRRAPIQTNTSHTPFNAFGN